MFLTRLRNHSIGWVIIMAVFGGGTAQAQLTNCKDPGPPETFKIFVDEVRSSDSTANSIKMQEKLQSIRKFLSDNLKLSSGEDASVRDCGKRFPNDTQDFDATEFDSLKNLRVVLEVWGVLEDPARGTGKIGFALLPARPLAAPAVYFVPSTNMLSALRQGQQMTAFAPLVLGIRRYQDQHYDEAVPLLCKGTKQLNALVSGASALGDATFRARQQELLVKIKTMTDDAVLKAGNIPGSNVAASKAANGGTFACPE